MFSEKKNILYVASTEIHLLSFHLPYLEWFSQKGYTVHVAYNGTNPIPFADVVWSIPFGRSPLATQNIKAFRQLSGILDQHHFELIHCHTPMASFVTRLAARKARRRGTEVLYTAHGFHFYNKGPLKNWFVYFSTEWLLSRFTDGIVTINKEDYQQLYRWKFGSTGKYTINGIGINPRRLQLPLEVDQRDTRKELGYREDQVLVLYIAEFIDRKNHRFILQALPTIIGHCPNIKLLFAGGGVLREKMMKLATEMGLENYIDFLGFRTDIGRFISITDIGISTSKQEGLGLGIAEMMYHRIPVVVSEDRGHKEMVIHQENGLMFPQQDRGAFEDAVMSLYREADFRIALGEKGRISMQKFLVENSLQQMIAIYANHLSQRKDTVRLKSPFQGENTAG